MKKKRIEERKVMKRNDEHFSILSGTGFIKLVFSYMFCMGEGESEGGVDLANATMAKSYDIVYKKAERILS